MIPYHFLDWTNFNQKVGHLSHYMCQLTHPPLITSVNWAFLKLTRFIKTDSEKKYFNGDNA